MEDKDVAIQFYRLSVLNQELCEPLLQKKLETIAKESEKSINIKLLTDLLYNQYLLTAKTANFVEFVDNLEFFYFEDLDKSPFSEDFIRIRDEEAEFWGFGKAKILSNDAKAEISDALDDFLAENSYVYHCFYDDLSYLVAKV